MWVEARAIEVSQEQVRLVVILPGRLPITSQVRAYNATYIHVDINNILAIVTTVANLYTCITCPSENHVHCMYLVCSVRADTILVYIITDHKKCCPTQTDIRISIEGEGEGEGVGQDERVCLFLAIFTKFACTRPKSAGRKK